MLQYNNILKGRMGGSGAGIIQHLSGYGLSWAAHVPTSLIFIQQVLHAQALAVGRKLYSTYCFYQPACALEPLTPTTCRAKLPLEGQLRAYTMWHSSRSP